MHLFQWSSKLLQIWPSLFKFIYPYRFEKKGVFLFFRNIKNFDQAVFVLFHADFTQSFLNFIPFIILEQILPFLNSSSSLACSNKFLINLLVLPANATVAVSNSLRFLFSIPYSAFIEFVVMFFS